MNIIRRSVLFTIFLYVMATVVIFTVDALYVPKSANDITGPPFMLMLGCGALILFFFLRSIYMAIAKNVSYWRVVVTHLILMLLAIFIFTV